MKIREILKWTGFIIMSILLIWAGFAMHVAFIRWVCK